MRTMEILMEKNWRIIIAPMRMTKTMIAAMPSPEVIVCERGTPKTVEPLMEEAREYQEERDQNVVLALDCSRRMRHRGRRLFLRYRAAGT